MIQPALLDLRLLLPQLALAPRGVRRARRRSSKFAPLIVLPLWSGYPDARDRGSRRRFLFGALVAAAASFVILLFDPSPLHGAEAFVHHTFGYQFGRSSPFSLWDWRQYHAKGLPDLHWVQRVLQLALLVGALVLYRWPQAALAAPDRRVHRRAARRLRDGADPLVVALPAVVLPVRRLRRPRAPHGRGHRPCDRARGRRADVGHPVVAEPGSVVRRARRLRTGTRIAAQLVARPSAPHSTSAPSIRTSPSATSSRSGNPVRNRRIGPAGLLPITESCGPVIPASVIAAVPPASTRASLVCTCVCVPSTAVALPVEVVGERDLLARRLRVEVDDDHRRLARSLLDEAIGRRRTRSRTGSASSGRGG